MSHNQPPVKIIVAESLYEILAQRRRGWTVIRIWEHSLETPADRTRLLVKLKETLEVSRRLGLADFP